MKRYIVYTIFVFSIGIIFGQSLIQEDRVWEVGSLFNDSHEDEQHPTCFTEKKSYLKFGNPKEFGGKQYFPVINFKTVWGPWCDPEQFEVFDDIAIIEAWLREDKGKVYMLLNGNCHLMRDDDDPLQEGLIFDFNLGEGEEYEGISLTTRVDGPLITSNYGYFKGLYKIVEIGREVINGNFYKSQKIVFRTDIDKTYWTPPLKVIEGIGCVEYGGMFFVCNYGIKDGYEYENSFYRYFDTEGNILYGPEYSDDYPMEQRFTQIDSPSDTSSNITSDDVRYFNLQGLEVSSPSPGDILIRTDGIKTEKIIF